MCCLMRMTVAASSAVLFLCVPRPAVSADQPDKKPQRTTKKLTTATQNADAKPEQSIPEINLLDAKRKGLVSVQAEGRGDGRMTVSVTNRTRIHCALCFLPA